MRECSQWLKDEGQDLEHDMEIAKGDEWESAVEDEGQDLEHDKMKAWLLAQVSQD